MKNTKLRKQNKRNTKSFKKQLKQKGMNMKKENNTKPRKNTIVEDILDILYKNKDNTEKYTESEELHIKVRLITLSMISSSERSDEYDKKILDLISKHPNSINVKKFVSGFRIENMLKNKKTNVGVILEKKKRYIKEYTEAEELDLKVEIICLASICKRNNTRENQSKLFEFLADNVGSISVREYVSLVCGIRL